MTHAQSIGVGILIGCALAVFASWAVPRWPGRVRDALILLLGGFLLAMPVLGVALMLGWKP